MTSTTRDYFDSMYRESSDPWHFETSEYERRKYELTVAALPKRTYYRGFEPGCSVGVLSELLARRCRHLTSMDFMDEPLERATDRLAAYQNVHVEKGRIPSDWPTGPFDLVVLSEIAYYFDENDLQAVVSRAISSILLGAHIIAVHWRGETNYPLTGDRAHEVIGAAPELRSLVHHVEADFVLDVWERIS